MTQTADQTRAVSGYYGNIDFEREHRYMDGRSTVTKSN